MTLIAEIEEQVSSLSKNEFVEIRNWILEQDANNWDQQIEKDIKTNKLDIMAQSAINEYKNKQFKEL